MSERARTLPRRVLETIRKHQLWLPGDSVLIAVSGGVDSTVLMHVLHRLQQAHGGALTVACVDHGLRAESAVEQAQVESEAAALGLAFVGLQVDLDVGPNLAARARDARRVALQSVGSDRIATGHHENDQAETVLFHLLRGSGTRGLRGMQPLDSPWCRPLLYEPREVLEAWASEEGLVWAEDPSNAASQRGHLRELMPRLDAVHGGATGALARSARLVARDDALLDALALEAWETVHKNGAVQRVALDALHPALQLRVLRKLVASCPIQVRADPLESILTGALSESGTLDLGGGWRLVQEGGWLRLIGPH